MSIELITGVPGQGKTLYTITKVKARSEKENRQVYYSGIKDLKLPWIELDNPEDWYKLPAGSIVVIDECQRVFRPRSYGTAVPVHVSEFETHRHRGLDVYLITQNPLLLDANVRRLVDTHFHCRRRFGAQMAAIFEFKEVFENVNRAHKSDDAIRHEFIFPREAYGWYHSAEVHTVKRRIPMRVWLIAMAPVLIIGLLYWAYSRVDALANPKAKQEVKEGGSLFNPSKESDAPRRNTIKTTAEFIAENTPRIHGLAHTAPAFDDVTKPVRAPYPAACVTWQQKGCRCYTAQATRLEVPKDLCETIAAKGFFISWDESRDKPVEKPSEKPITASSSEPERVVGGGLISAPAPVTLSPSPKPDGGGPSTNPRFNPPS